MEQLSHTNTCRRRSNSNMQQVDLEDVCWCPAQISSCFGLEGGEDLQRACFGFCSPAVYQERAVNQPSYHTLFWNSVFQLISL